MDFSPSAGGGQERYFEAIRAAWRGGDCPLEAIFTEVVEAG